MSWYMCRDCGKDVELSFNANGCVILCEECQAKLDEEVEAAWKQTLKRANEN